MVGKLPLIGRCIRRGSAILALAPLFAPTAALAGGFLIQEQSTAHQGASFAGVVSEPRDASTIFFNPAGLTRLDGVQSTSGGTLILPSFDYDDTGSTIATPATGAPVGNSGGDGGNPFDPTLVPSLAIAAPLLDGRLWLGLGVNSPFGLTTDYDDGWIGRYDSTSSELMTINLAPTVAVKVADWLSIGGGVDIQYAHAMLQSAVPDPTVALPSAATDGEAELEGEDWGIGYNVGLLVEPVDGVRVGVHYRSEMELTLDGRLLLQLPAGIGGAVTSRSAVVDLTLPRMVTAGISYDITDAWTLMGRYSWIGWSSFDELRAQFGDGGPDQVETQGYRNTHSVAAGVEHRPTKNLALRTGFQWDQTPTVDMFRNTRTPDGDRYWASAGLSYAIGSYFTVDVAYSHIFVDGADIALTRGFAPLGSAATINGSIATQIDLVSAALTFRF